MSVMGFGVTRSSTKPPLDLSRYAGEDCGEGPLPVLAQKGLTHGWWQRVVRNRRRRSWSSGPAPGPAAAKAGNPRHHLQRQDGRAAGQRADAEHGRPPQHHRQARAGTRRRPLGPRRVRVLLPPPLHRRPAAAVLPRRVRRTVPGHRLPRLPAAAARGLRGTRRRLPCRAVGKPGGDRAAVAGARPRCGRHRQGRHQRDVPGHPGQVAVRPADAPAVRRALPRHRAVRAQGRDDEHRAAAR